MTPVEQWKPIPDFPGYDVSDCGRIRSYYERNVTGWCIADVPQRILKGGIDRYPFVCIRDAGGASQVKTVHSLVMLAFVGLCPDGLEICHNDGDHQNNSLTNLRYDTHVSNMQDACEHGVMNSLSAQDILDIRNRRINGATYTDMARDYQVAISTISAICQGNSYRYIDGPRTTGRQMARKLSDQDIVTIRQLLTDDDIMQSTIAKMYNVSNSLISRIKHNTRRTSIEEVRYIDR